VFSVAAHKIINGTVGVYEAYLKKSIMKYKLARVYHMKFQQNL
jgi:hypothetical protein